MLQKAGQIKNTVFLISQHIQCLHLIYSEVDWVLLYSESQVQPQKILDPDYLSDYVSVFYDYNFITNSQITALAITYFGSVMKVKQLNIYCLTKVARLDTSPQR